LVAVVATGEIQITALRWAQRIGAKLVFLLEIEEGGENDRRPGERLIGN
jgi:hypothetical protein